MRLPVLLAASALALAAAASAQTLTPEPWDSTTSLETERESAGRGHVPSQLALARRYQAGDGVPRNPDLAADYWAAAAIADPGAGMPGLRALAAGNMRARALLGRLLLAETAPEARAEGRALLTVAGDAGSADANFILATMLASSPRRADRREAQVLFARAERAGGWLGSASRFLREQVGRGHAVPEATVSRGAPLVEQVRFWPVGNVRVDYARWGLAPDVRFGSELARATIAARIFGIAEAAYSGDAGAWLLFLWETSRQCVADERIYRSACAANVDGQQLLKYHSLTNKSFVAETPRGIDVAKLFELGDGGEPDFVRARRLYEWIQFRPAAESDRPEAAYRLSLMTAAGKGGPADPAEARKLLVQAADGGQPVAAYALALEQLRANDMEGLGSYLRIAADGGNADAAYYYAQLLSENKLTSRRRPEHLYKYFTQAAEAGNRRAFYGIGLCHWNGWGVPVDEAQAELWWEKAARVGDPKAADHVAAFYLQRSDPAGAIPWLRRAAQGGYPGSGAKLQEVLDKGYRERNLGGFLMGVLDFVGDVGTGMAEAYQYQVAQEQAEIRRQMIYYSAAMAGSSSSGSRSEGSGEAGGSDYGSGGGDAGGADGSGYTDGDSGSGGGSFGGSDGYDGGGSDQASADGYGGDAGGFAGGDSGSGDGGFFGGSSDEGGAYGSASSSGGADSSSGSSGSGDEVHGAIIVSDGIDHEWEARQAQLQAESLALQQRMAAEAAQAQADHDAAVAADEAKAREDAAAYAASGCDDPNTPGSCVSPQ